LFEKKQLIPAVQELLVSNVTWERGTLCELANIVYIGYNVRQSLPRPLMDFTFKRLLPTSLPKFVLAMMVENKLLLRFRVTSFSVCLS